MLSVDVGIASYDPVLSWRWFVSAYVVDLDQARGAIGSGNGELWWQIKQRYAEDLAEDEEVAKVVRFVLADSSDEDVEDCFVEAFELICRALSVQCENEGPFPGNWPEVIDSGFCTLNIDAIRFATFAGGTTLTFPGGVVRDGVYGEWTHRECVTAVEQWKATTAEQRKALDVETLKWIEAGIGLASTAARTPNYGVAGFLQRHSYLA